MSGYLHLPLMGWWLTFGYSVPIHSFGYGKSHDPASLWLISNHTSGTYTFVKDWYVYQNLGIWISSDVRLGMTYEIASPDALAASCLLVS